MGLLTEFDTTLSAKKRVLRSWRASCRTTRKKTRSRGWLVEHTFCQVLYLSPTLCSSFNFRCSECHAMFITQCSGSNDLQPGQSFPFTMAFWSKPIHFKGKQSFLSKTSSSLGWVFARRESSNKVSAECDCPGNAGQLVNICKLAVLPGARLHKLALHYSRVADPPHPRNMFFWAQCGARTECGPVRNISTRRTLIGFCGQWRGSCRGHKRRTTQSPLSCLFSLVSCPLSLLLLLHSLSLVSPLPSVFSLVPSVVFRWTFV